MLFILVVLEHQREDISVLFRVAVVRPPPTGSAQGCTPEPRREQRAERQRQRGVQVYARAVWAVVCGSHTLESGGERDTGRGRRAHLHPLWCMVALSIPREGKPPSAGPTHQSKAPQRLRLALTPASPRPVHAGSESQRRSLSAQKVNDLALPPAAVAGGPNPRTRARLPNNLPQEQGSLRFRHRSKAP